RPDLPLNQSLRIPHLPDAAHIGDRTRWQRSEGTGSSAGLRRTRVMNAALEYETNARHESMSELWRINGPALTRFALKLTLGDKHRAEDIIQETLVRAWRHPE